MHSKTNRKERKCDNCRKDLIRTDYFNDKKVFCSKKCADIFHSLRMEGINNPNWKGGIGKLPYKYDFVNKLKERIRNKFGNKCFICKKSRKDIKF